MKVGLLGAGFMGGMHAACYDNIEGANLALIADVKFEKAEELAKKHGAQPIQSADSLIENPDIDVVDVCLPTYLHKEYVVQAARAGKHVLCEKPIALTVDEAQAMIDATRQAGVTFMVGHVIRFWPEYTRLKKIYESKELGTLLSLTLTRLAPYPDWSEWMGDLSKSGGALVDLHIHDVDFLLYVLGPPTWLHAHGSPNHVTTLYGYPQFGAVVSEGGFVFSEAFAFRMLFNAMFENGVVEYDSTKSPSLSICRAGKTDPERVTFEPPRPIEGDFGGNISMVWPYLSEIQYFADCIRNGVAPSRASGESARDSLKAVLSEKQSLESGNIIEIA